MFNRHLLKAGKLSFLALMISLSVSATTFAASYIWDASNTGCDLDEWTDTDCWDDMDGLKWNAVPGSSDYAHFKQDSGGCTIPSGATVNVLGLYSNYGTSYYNGSIGTATTNTITLGEFNWTGSGSISFSSAPLTVNGNVSVTNGTVNFGSAAVSVSGEFSLSNSPVVTMTSGTMSLYDYVYIATGVTFSTNNGTVKLAGGTGDVLDISKALYNLTIEKSSSGVTHTVSNYDLTVNGTFTMTQGKLVVNSGRVLDLNGASNINGGEISMAGTSTIDSIGAFTIAGGSVVSNSNTGAWTFNSSLAISSGSFSATDGDILVFTTYTQSGGTATFSTGKLEVNGTFSQNAGTINMGGGTFQLDGSTTSISGTADFNGGATGTLDVNGAFSVTTSVTVNAPYHTKMAGNFTIGPDAVWGDGAESFLMEFDYAGTSTQTVEIQNGTSTESFYSMKVNLSSSGNLTINTDWITVHELTLTDGIVNGTGKILVLQDYLVGSAFSGGSLTVELSGSVATEAYIQNNGTSPKLIINNPNAELRPVPSSSSVVINFGNTVTVTNGLLSLDTEYFDGTGLSFQGPVTANFASSLTVNGSGGVLDLVRTTDQFGNVLASVSSTFTLSAGTVNGGLTSLSGTSLTVSGGTFNTNNSTLTFTGTANFQGGLFNAGSSQISFANSFTISNSSYFNAGTSTLTLNGNASSNLSIANNTTLYNFTINQTTDSSILYTASNNFSVSNTLTLTNGKIRLSGTVINVLEPRNFVYASTFDGQESGTGYLNFIASDDYNTVTISTIDGTGTVNLPGFSIDENGKTGFTFEYSVNRNVNYVGPVRLVSNSGSSTLFKASSSNTDVTFSGGIQVGTGTLNAGNGAFSAGSSTVSGGAVNIGGSTVSFTSLLTQSGGTITAAPTTLTHSFTLNLSGGLYDISGMAGGSTSNFNTVNVIGGTFKGGASSMTFSTDLVIYAGTFDAGTGDYTLTNSTSDLTVNNYSGGANNVNVDFSNNNITVRTFTLGRSGATGTFKAPSASKTFSVNYQLAYNGGTTFDANGGTVVFNGTTGTIQGSVALPFNNLTFDIGDGQQMYISGGEVYGTLSFLDGYCSSSTIQAKGPFTYSADADGGNCTIAFSSTSAQTVNIPDTALLPNITLNSATTVLNAPTSGSIRFDNNFTVTAGEFNQNGTAILIDNNFTQNGGIYDGYSGGTSGGNVTVTNDALIDYGTFTSGSGDWSVGGTLDVNSVTAASAVVDFSTSNLTIAESLDIGYGSSTGSFTAPGSSKLLSVSQNITRYAQTTAFNPNNGTIRYVGVASVSIPGQTVPYYNLEIQKDPAAIVTISAAQTINGSFHLVSGIVNAQSHTLNIGGDWDVDSGSTFNAGTSTVVLGAGSHNINGSTTFYNLSKIGSSELVFEAGSTTTITGTWTCQGESESNRLVLRSSALLEDRGTPEAIWYINPQGTRTISNLDVQDSFNTNATAIDARGTGSIPHASLPNNFNWIFDSAPEVTNLGPPELVDGSETSEKQPTLTFDIDDENNDLVEYQIQIATDSEFESLVVDFSSGFLTEGSKSFSVGQELGEDGFYTEGSIGQELADGSYYWRVQARNQAGLYSGWEEVTQGVVDFVIDGTPPGPVVQVSPKNGYDTGDTTPRLRWIALTDPTVNRYVIDVTTIDDTDYSDVVETATINDPNATQFDITQPLGFTSYRWRIYAIDNDELSGEILIMDEETGLIKPNKDAEFDVINLVPEFNTYLYTLMFLAGAYFIFRMRQKEEM